MLDVGQKKKAFMLEVQIIYIWPPKLFKILVKGIGYDSIHSIPFFNLISLNYYYKLKMNAFRFYYCAWYLSLGALHLHCISLKSELIKEVVTK